MRIHNLFFPAFMRFGSLVKLGCFFRKSESEPTCQFLGTALFILWVTLIDMAMPVPDWVIEPLYLLPIFFVFWKACLINSCVITVFCLLAYFVSRESVYEDFFKDGHWGMHIFITLLGLTIALGVFLKMKSRLIKVEMLVKEQESMLGWKSRKLEVLEKELLKNLEIQRIEMAGELHDGLAQEFSAVAFKCRMLQEDLASEGSAHADSLGVISSILKQCVEQSRQIASNLLPADLGGAGLIEALRGFAARAESSYQTICLFKHTGAQPRLSQSVSLHLLRIVQEAFSNAIRHGKAGHVEILFDCTGDDFQLRIQDMGCGFMPAEVSDQGLGLRLMRLRASLAGLNLRIHSCPYHGTLIEVSSNQYRSMAERREDLPKTEILHF